MAFGSAALALGGCAALPRSGPLASQITTAEQPGDLEGLVAPLTAEIAALASPPRQRGFPPEFMAAREIDPEVLGVGDVLELTVWEGAESPLLGDGAGGARLVGVRIDPSGRIFVPFVGMVEARGLTRARLRARVQQALQPLTLTPQVDLRLVEPHSRMLSVQGLVQRAGMYAIEPGATRLAPMLALAGGATQPPEQIEVAVRRDGRVGVATLEDVYADPALDIAVLPRDQIVLKALRERFVVLGATSIQGEIAFPTRELSLLAALGAARGLRDFDADPTGVFVFRRESRALADALLSGPQPPELPSASETRPIVYRLDLTRPDALFTAGAFKMRDQDAIFATNAPLTELRKVFQLFSLGIAPVQQVSAVAQ